VSDAPVSASGRLVFPAIRWSDAHGFDHAESDIDLALGIGAGGFCLFGGTAAAVRDLTAMLRARSHVPLLIASDVERGAGQQFAGATQLPPLAAIGWVDDPAATRRAGAITAREALAVGVNWLFAPVADIDLEPLNPIVGSRAFSDDARHVARHVAAWINGARTEGALCCAKHFPGHGRTREDSHAALPRVTADAAALEVDLMPFRAAIDAGVDSLMTAHVVYDALDAGIAATLSRRVLDDLARERLGFDGLIVSDALNMAGVLRASGDDEARAAVLALNAGCDALLYPDDVAAVARALAAGAAAGTQPADGVDAVRMADALRRVEAAARRGLRQGVGEGGAAGEWGAASDRAWAEEVALRSTHALRGSPRVGQRCAVLTIDDDAGGPYRQPARDAFAETLRKVGIDARPVDEAAADVPVVIAVYADIRAWKGAPGMTAAARSRLESALVLEPDATVVYFGHRRVAADAPGAHLLCAWGGEAIMQRAAARRLTGRP
jgi:beta-glucosidase-like glycosyl hydrolase